MNIPQRLSRFHSEIISPWLPPQTLFFLLVWGALMLVGRHTLFQDPGTFWHTVLGIESVQQGQIPERDTFTFTRNGERWLTLQWAAEVAMGTSYQLGGWDLQLLLTVSLLAFFFTWLLHRGLVQGLHWLPASLLVVVAIGACSHHFHIRPHIASIFLIGWTYARVVDVEAENRSGHHLWLLVPVFAVWTNLHGGVLGGLLTVGTWWAAWMAWKTLRRETPSWPLWLLPAVLFGTFFLNPYGWEMPATWIEIMTLPLPGIITEHGPTQWNRPEGIAYLILLGGYAYVLGDAVSHSKKVRIAWLLPLIWAVLAYGRVRHVPLFSVTACLAIIDMMPFARLAKRLEETESFFYELIGVQPSWPQLARWLAAPACLLLTCLALQLSHVEVPVIGANWAEPPAYRWPIKTTEKLSQLTHADYTPNVFNELNFGGYITMHAPHCRIYVDDRCELFGGDFLTHYMSLQRSPNKVDQMIGIVDFALVHADSAIARHLDKSSLWTRIAADECSVLYSVRELELASR